MPHADTEAMNAHLAEISRTVAEGAHAILVLDGAGWHGTLELRLPENITLLRLPPYAPELNPIGNVRAYLRASRLAISVLEKHDEIVARCCDAWNFFANDIDTVRSITNRDDAEAVRDQGRWYEACVYLARLADADETALRDLIRAGLERLAGRWPVSPS